MLAVGLSSARTNLLICDYFLTMLVTHMQLTEIANTLNGLLFIWAVNAVIVQIDHLDVVRCLYDSQHIRLYYILCDLQMHQDTITFSSRVYSSQKFCDKRPLSPTEERIH